MYTLQYDRLVKINDGEKVTWTLYCNRYTDSWNPILNNIRKNRTTEILITNSV